MIIKSKLSYSMGKISIAGLCKIRNDFHPELRSAEFGRRAKNGMCIRLLFQFQK